jgi:Tol biopolymer transport system component
MYSAVGKSEWQPILGSNFREQYGTFSPDGKWIAYQSNEAGSEEIWVTDFLAADKGIASRSTAAVSHGGERTGKSCSMRAATTC